MIDSFNFSSGVTFNPLLLIFTKKHIAHALVIAKVIVEIFKGFHLTS